MLKRISGTFNKDSASDPAFLIPPRGQSIPPSSPKLTKSPRNSPSSQSFPLPPVAPASPSYPFPYTPVPPVPTLSRSLERPVLHRSLAALNALLVALDELRETSSAQAKAEKKVAKAVKDLAGGFTEKAAGSGGKSEVIVEALGGCASMFEVLSEVDGKHAKSVQKEYESVNETVSRYFKKTAKEEKTYDDTLSTLDAKVSKATASYQSSAAPSSTSRNPHAALNSLTSQHSAYMQLLSQLSGQVQQIKGSYAETIAVKREAVVREVAKVACGMAEREWRNRVEGTRKGGKEIGKVVAGGTWCEAGMEEGGAATFSAEAAEQQPAREEVSRTPTAPAPTNDASPPFRQGQFAMPPDRNLALRGPRPSSASTTLTGESTSHPSQSGSSISYDSSLSAPTSSTRQQQPVPGALESRQATTFSTSTRPPQQRRDSEQLPAPSAPPATRKISFDIEPDCSREARPAGESGELGGGRTLPRGFYVDPSFSAPTELATPREELRSPPLLASTAELRKPTPRYGSTPAGASGSQVQNEVDEFGRASVATVKREDSFVARMSQKYAGGNSRVELTGLEDSRSRETGGHSAEQTQPAGHHRSSSRVSQLAKRYSSPPEAICPVPPTSPTTLQQCTSPASRSDRRPLPPAHRHSTSMQNFSTSSTGSNTLDPSPGSSSISSHLPPPSSRPQFGIHPSNQASTSSSGSSHRQQQQESRRPPRAYERASPLPSSREEQAESMSPIRAVAGQAQEPSRPVTSGPSVQRVTFSSCSPPPSMSSSSSDQ
ncbi:hypothetical protein JCM11641_004084 [Rhodosporidiobolus odoratus]